MISIFLFKRFNTKATLLVYIVNTYFARITMAQGGRHIFALSNVVSMTGASPATTIHNWRCTLRDIVVAGLAPVMQKCDAHPGHLKKTTENMNKEKEMLCATRASIMSTCDCWHESASQATNRRKRCWRHSTRVSRGAIAATRALLRHVL